MEFVTSNLELNQPLESETVLVCSSRGDSVSIWSSNITNDHDDIVEQEKEEKIIYVEDEKLSKEEKKTFTDGIVIPSHISSNEKEEKIAQFAALKLTEDDNDDENSREKNDFHEERPTKSNIALSINKGHAKFINVLNSRQQELQTISDLWKQGKIVQVIDHLIQLNDPAVSADVLGSISIKNHATFELCGKLLSVLNAMIESFRSNIFIEDHLKIALQHAIFLLRSFERTILFHVSHNTEEKKRRNIT